MEYTRIDSLDFIRGVAILGILIMNVFAMAVPNEAYSVPQWSVNSIPSDNVVYILQSIFIESRFMSMFALLFGVGLALQSDRILERAGGLGSLGGAGLGDGGASAAEGAASATSEKNKSRQARKQERKLYVPVLRRRLLWLMVFGLIHGFALWFGDILLNYAIAGLIGLVSLRWKARTLVITGVVLLIFGQMLQLMGFGTAVASGKNILLLPMMPMTEETIASMRMDWALYPDRFMSNASNNILFVGIGLLSSVWHYLGLMMFGVVLYRKGFFMNRSAWKGGIVLLALSLGLGGLIVWLRFMLGIDTSAAGLLGGVMLIPGLLGGLAYISFMVPISSGESLLVRSLRNTGKTAFTLYISQTLITLLVFTVIVPQWWGVFNRLELLLYVLVFSVLQVMFAHYWQSTRGRGPLEKIWRNLSRPKALKSAKGESA